MVLSGGLVVQWFCCLVVLLLDVLVVQWFCCLVVLLSGGLVVWWSSGVVIFWESVWKTVPSKARVTRDEVSGLKTRRGKLSGRQYQNCMTTEGLIFIYLPILEGTVFQTAPIYWVVIPRLRPGLLSLRSVLSSRQTTYRQARPIRHCANSFYNWMPAAILPKKLSYFSTFASRQNIDFATH